MIPAVGRLDYTKPKILPCSSDYILQNLCRGISGSFLSFSLSVRTFLIVMHKLCVNPVIRRGAVQCEWSSSEEIAVPYNSVY